MNVSLSRELGWAALRNIMYTISGPIALYSALALLTIAAGGMNGFSTLDIGVFVIGLAGGLVNIVYVYHAGERRHHLLSTVVFYMALVTYLGDYLWALGVGLLLVAFLILADITPGDAPDRCLYCRAEHALARVAGGDAR